MGKHTNYPAANVFATVWTGLFFIPATVLLCVLLYHLRFRLGLVTKPADELKDIGSINSSAVEKFTASSKAISEMQWFNNPSKQIATVAVLYWMAVFLMLISWALVFVHTDDVRATVRGLDAAWMCFAGLGEATLCYALLSRLDLIYGGTPYAYADSIFQACYVLIGCFLIVVLLITVGHATSIWQLVLWSTFVTAVVLPVYALWITTMFSKPISQIAQFQDDRGLMSVATRFAILSFTGLGSTVFLKVLLLVWYFDCDMCAVSYVYFIWAPVDKVLNLLCLLCTVKEGRQVYGQCFGGAHTRVLLYLSTSKGFSVFTNPTELEYNEVDAYQSDAVGSREYDTEVEYSTRDTDDEYNEILEKSS